MRDAVTAARSASSGRYGQSSASGRYFASYAGSPRKRENIRPVVTSSADNGAPGSKRRKSCTASSMRPSSSKFVRSANQTLVSEGASSRALSRCGSARLQRPRRCSVSARLPSASTEVGVEQDGALECVLGVGVAAARKYRCPSAKRSDPARLLSRGLAEAFSAATESPGRITARRRCDAFGEDGEKVECGPVRGKRSIDPAGCGVSGRVGEQLVQRAHACTGVAEAWRRQPRRNHA